MKGSVTGSSKASDEDEEPVRELVWETQNYAVVKFIFSCCHEASLYILVANYILCPRNFIINIYNEASFMWVF